jgi:hypothetical protein
MNDDTRVADEGLGEAFERVLRDHADCTLNSDSDQLGSSVTGVDAWSCGLRLPFRDDLDDAIRAHVAEHLAALVAGRERAAQAEALEAAAEDFDRNPMPSMREVRHRVARILRHRARALLDADAGRDGRAET